MLEKKVETIGKGRLEHIDRSAGIAILLVVYAHILFPETRRIGWYITSAEFIYKFHMPLFMCLSGYLAFMSASNRNIRSETDYISFQKKKVYKFFPVYLFFSLFSLGIDIFYHHAPVAELRKSIFSFFFSPTESSAAFLWYLYVLMGFYLITPFLLRFKTSSLCVLLAFGFLLTNISITSLFCFEFFCKFFFFFLWGGMIYKYNNRFIDLLKRRGPMLFSLAVLLVVIDLLTGSKVPYQLICLIIIPAIFYISLLQWPRFISNIFVLIGRSSFAIYLLNTTLLNVCYILFKSMPNAGEIGGLFIFPVLLITILVAVLFRLVFNRLVPGKVYTL